MTKYLSRREKLLIFFKFFLIVFFFITFPFLILFAKGYRYNFKTKKFQPTGLLIIKSTPSTDLKIYIDEKLQKNNRTPLKKNLFVGEHKIKIEKEGFYPWEKLVKIEKEKITWEETVVLVPIDPQKILVKENVKEYSISPGFNFLVSISSEAFNQIAILNIKSQEKKTFQIGKNLSILEISPNEENILLENKETNQKDIIVYNHKTEKSLIFKNLTKASFLDDNKIIGQDNQGQLLVYFLSSEKPTPNIIDKNVLNFVLRNEKEIFVIKKDKEEKYLAIKNIDSKNETFLEKVNFNELQYIKSAKNNQEALIVNNGDLFILENKQLKMIDKEVKKAFFDQKGEKLIYGKTYEIWVYFIYKNRIKVEEKQLITRVSDAINLFTFYPDENHILYQQKNKLFFIDFDGRNQILITDQLKENNKFFYIIDEKEFFYINKENSLIKIKFPKKENIVETIENLLLIRWSG